MVPRQFSEGVLAPLQPPARFSNIGLHPGPESQLSHNLFGKGKNGHKNVSSTPCLINNMLWALLPQSTRWGIWSACLICWQNKQKRRNRFSQNSRELLIMALETDLYISVMFRIFGGTFTPDLPLIRNFIACIVYRQHSCLCWFIVFYQYKLQYVGKLPD